MHSGEHDEDGRFEGRTYLMIRDHLLDDGTEPLPALLPAWLSPDIKVRKPDGTLGGEAEIGGVNQVEITVTNRGGVDAVGVYVDAYFASSATGFTPTTASLISGAYIDVSGYGMTTLALPWMPDAAFAGHGCILARASLVIPPDTYADPLTFDARGDRHVAQRNIEVVSFVEDGEAMRFMFNIVNPRQEAVLVRVSVQELREELELRAVGAALGGQVAAFAREPLQVFGLMHGERRLVPDEGGRLRDIEDIRRRAPLSRSVGSARMDRELECQLEPGEVCQAELHAVRNRGSLRGLLHPLEIRQVDERGEVMGGITVVLRD